jgi:hypothetical protein
MVLRGAGGAIGDANQVLERNNDLRNSTPTMGRDRDTRVEFERTTFYVQVLGETTDRGG